jgi:hypothetical protein
MEAKLSRKLADRILEKVYGTIFAFTYSDSFGSTVETDLSLRLNRTFHIVYNTLVDDFTFHQFDMDPHTNAWKEPVPQQVISGQWLIVGSATTKSIYNGTIDDVIEEWLSKELLETGDE